MGELEQNLLRVMARAFKSSICGANQASGKASVSHKIIGAGFDQGLL